MLTFTYTAILSALPVSDDKRKLAELFQERPLFLNDENSDEQQEYEKLLEEFHQIPSYVERFQQEKETHP